MARDRDRGGREERQDGLEDRVVKIRRCAAVVKGGRRFSFNALVVVGDNRGRVATGYGKANEVPPAVDKATKDATETLKRQKRVSMRGDTIPHRVIGRYGASKVVLVPAGPGTGVKAGPGVRDVLECCGVRILGDGDFTKKLTVRADHFSKTAKEKIEKAGGTCDLVPPPKKPVRNKMTPRPPKPVK